MEKIILRADVEEKLHTLSKLLFENNYFSYIENANHYVNEIYDFIYTIPHHKHYLTKHNKYGHFYCRYKPNKHTTYYITFDTMNDVYLIKNIISSHTPQYPRYIKGI